MRDHKLFQIRDLGDDIYFIVDRSTVGMYLVIGTQKAALIDCGTGIGDLKECVETITDKPVQVLATHGHVDHIGGACNYDRIYINEKDTALMRESLAPEKRLEFGEFVRSINNDQSWTVKDLVENRELHVVNVEPGDVFELGGRTLTAVNMAGHTKGSMGYFDDRTGTLFAGDGCNNSTFLFGEEATEISQYKKTLLRVKEQLGGNYKRHAICHDYSFVPMECIDNVIECCDTILNGNADADSFSNAYEAIGIRTESLAWAKAGGADRVDKKFGNIAYDTKRIN